MTGWLGADNVQSMISGFMLLSLGVITVASELHFEMNREPVRWFDAFYGCYQQNQVLPSAALLTKGDNKDKLEELHELLPMWVYAFQVADPRDSEDDESDYFVISTLEKEDLAAVFCRVDDETFVPMREMGTFSSVDTLCRDHRQQHLTYDNRFQIKPLTNTHVWIENFDKLVVGRVMNLDGIDNTVYCLVLDENLELRIDNCQSKHYSICVNASVESTVRYLGNQNSDSIPFLSKPTTPKSGSVVTPPNRRAGILMDQGLLIALAAVGGVVLVAIVLAIYCCYCRQRFCIKTKELKLADGYSETMDSIPDNFSIQDNVSEYATPDDTLGGVKFAKPRNSVIEGDYDTLQQTNTKQKPARKVAVVNAYSHVAIVPPNPRQSVSSNEEGHYDVTTFHKQASITISADDNSGNIYGHLNSAKS